MIDTSSARRRLRFLAGGAIAALFATAAQAADVAITTDPLAGTGAREDPARNIIQAEPFFIYDPTTDEIVIDTDVVPGFEDGVRFFNGAAEDIEDEPFNFVVLRTLDFLPGDANPGNQLAAGQAAALIAGQLSTSGAGFFVYFNSVLQRARLVFSDDLSDPTADLRVVARFDNLGEAGALGDFTRDSVQASVPEPAAWALMIAGFGLAGGAVRRARRTAAVAA